ncbi:MAG: hypothetical protein ACP5IO_06070 [Elusimicrobiales bacterium]
MRKFILSFAVSLFISAVGAEYYDNFFESRDYVVILRFSLMYSSHKLVFEKVIEGSKRLYVSPLEFKKVKELNAKALEFLSKVYDSYKDPITRSQIHQIKLEIELLNLHAEKILSDYKKNARYSYPSIVAFEKELYRMEIYFRGLSKRLSDL